MLQIDPQKDMVLLVLTKTMELFTHQEEGINFLKKMKVGMLLWDMGAGKTLTTLLTLDELRKRALVVTVPHAVDQWKEEKDKWKLGTNFDIFSWDSLKVPPNGGYSVLVLDESQKVKDPRTKRWKKLLKIMDKYKFEKVWCLSGTPFPNNYTERYYFWYLLNRFLGGKIVSWTNFLRTYFVRDLYARFPRWFPKRNYFRVVESTIKKFIHYAKLPEDIPLVEQVFKLQMPSVLHNIYLEAKNEFVINAKKWLQSTYSSANGDDVLRLKVETQLMKLVQLSSGFYYDESKSPHWVSDFKMRAIEESLTGRLSILWCNFIAQKHWFQSRLGNKAVVFTKTKDIHRWSEKVPYLIANPRSIGEALNLQKGQYSIWVTPVWSFTQSSQADARLRRPGQKHCVVVQKFITEGTMDEIIYKVLRRKKCNFRQLVEGVCLGHRSCYQKR